MARLVFSGVPVRIRDRSRLQSVVISGSIVDLMAETSQRWTLPSVTRELAEQQTAVALALPRVDFASLQDATQQLVGETPTCVPLELCRAPCDENVITCVVEHRAGRRMAVTIATPLWHAALGALLGDSERTSVPTEAERGVLLYICEQLVRSALEDGFHVAGITTTARSLCFALAVDSIDQLRWAARTTVTLGDVHCTAYILCPEPILENRAHRHHSARSLPVPCFVSAGWAQLRTKDLGLLEVDSVVLLDRFGIDPHGSRLSGKVRLVPVSSAGLCWECDMQEGKLTLRKMEREQPKTDETADLRSLPVTLHVELARLSLTLGELETLQPGHVLRLAKSVGETVTLSANGQPIAEGEVVDVEGELGVRLVRLLGVGHGA